MTTFAQVPGESGRARAYRYLRDQVLTNPAVEGTFLNELEIGKAIGVSRTPVREALLLLVADELVQMVPNRGAYVPPLTSRQTAELFELRSLLEAHAAKRVLKQGNPPTKVMSELIQRQEGLIERTEDASHPVATFIELDRQFHQTLVDAAGNELISRTYSGLRDRQTRVGIAALLQTTDRKRSVCFEHRRIVEGLIDNDEFATVEAIENHLQTTLRLAQRH